MATFEVGEHALCRWGPDRTWHVCELLQRRENGRGQPPSFYVHYLQLDRRNDQWVSQPELRAITPELLSGAPESPAAPDCPSPAQIQTLILQHQQQNKLLLQQAAPHLPSPGVADSDLLLLSPKPGGGAASGGPGVRTRKRKFGDISAPSQLELSDPADAALEKEHEERTKIKNIDVVSIGQYDVDCWYYSPYPEGYRNLHKIYVCEFCLRYMRKPKTMAKHKPQCRLRHPPGDEIYRDGNIAVFEVDGGSQPIYCQCLCLLAKFFIDHKTLYYDVEPFLFYVLTEIDEHGHHVVGYFSKEKHSAEGYNLACILTFPQYQRRGYGRLLIALSYALSRLEGVTGSPEKPLSDLGRISYRSYWTRTILEMLEQLPADASVDDVARHTGIRSEDVISTLKFLGLIRYVRGDHVIVCTPKLIKQHQERLPQPKAEHVQLDPSKLVWTKPVFNPQQQQQQLQTNGDGSAALAAAAAAEPDKPAGGSKAGKSTRKRSSGGGGNKGRAAPRKGKR